ncbi:hypothetical protein ACFVTJ_04060 [Agrobacterium sp. NPDC058088]|uniref:hypothetical protein n=1 Tax=Agrobacterium TaxID=357 RepID=UPI00157206A5|nr:hypothetical protein [Agrobacterium tumefaciens]WHO22655.1 hypothetical protein G6L90_06750 [Agrobacterium tumefaciens]
MAGKPMTKRTPITQAELKRMAAIAKSEGVTVSVEMDGRKFSVSPHTALKPAREEYEYADINSYEGWKKRNSHKKLPDDFAL